MLPGILQSCKALYLTQHATDVSMHIPGAAAAVKAIWFDQL